MFAQARKAYVLMGVEPELDCANPQQALAALEQAALVLMVTPFLSEAAMAYADVLLPSAVFAETAGTYINTEGRVQSVHGACRPPGDARPGWKVLRVLANVLALPGFDYESSEQVRDEFIPGGTVFINHTDNGVDLPLSPIISPVGNGLERIADVPIYFSDALVRRSPALQQTKDAEEPLAYLHPETLSALAVDAGGRLKVSQGQGISVLQACADATVPPGCVRVAAAHPTTAMLGEMFGLINVERA